VKEFLRNHESHITELEHININVDVEDVSIRGVDEAISRVQSAVDDIESSNRPLPAVESDLIPRRLWRHQPISGFVPLS
jgi:hypothetical protein